MKRIKKVNIFFCGIFIVLLASCSLKIHEPERLELIYFEKNIINETVGRKTNDEISSEKLLYLLENTLKDIGLPKDYITIKVIDSKLPLCFVGISREMYVSNSIIMYFNEKEISGNEMKAILIHEISHKIKDHPYSLISTLSFDWEHREIDGWLAFDVVKLGITAAASYFFIKNFHEIKTHPFKSKSQMALGLSQAANLQLTGKEPAYKQLFAAYFNPLTGFNYPLEYEYEADLLAVEKLQK